MLSSRFIYIKIVQHKNIYFMYQFYLCEFFTRLGMSLPLPSQGQSGEFQRFVHIKFSL